ncbi:MAG: hypothetical protein KA444_08060 [Bacteroidia bacterium]|nr:hypothetical protein [Bacteroidia bacterium]
MIHPKPFRFFLLFICLCGNLYAQTNVTTVGIQFKPIFPLAFLGTGEQISQDKGVDFTIGLNSGFAGGMVVRRGFSDLLSLEAGINYVKRKYSLKIQDGDYTIDNSFRIIGYEIPVSLLVYIQLGEKLYMNVSMGPSLDMFASSVQIEDSNYRQTAFRNNLIQGAVLANIGWEWRTEKDGYFYIGASYHRPFQHIYISHTEYVIPGKLPTDPNAMSETNLLGNYLTLDFRYFFHEDPENKKKRK